MFERMHQGQNERVPLPGFNPLAAGLAQGQAHRGAVEPEVPGGDGPPRHRNLEFWRNDAEFNNVKTAEIKTEVVPPADGVLRRDDGTFTNSGRVIAWKEKGADRPATARATARSWPACSWS